MWSKFGSERTTRHGGWDQAAGSTLYVTLEPCCHHGKTPPCTEAILQAGVSRVVSAMCDPFPRVDGGGLARLRALGVEVDMGLMAGQAGRLNGPYLKRLTTGLPYVIAKWAMTLDGRTATKTGDSRWISGSRSRSIVHETRGRVDAIAVGIGTVLADDPELTARPPGPRSPVRLILDSSARLPVDGKLVRSCSEVPVWVAVNDHASINRRQTLQDLGCQVLAFEGKGRVPVVPLLEELGRRGMTNVLVEGGGAVIGSFLDAEQVDEVDVFLAPLLEGGTHDYSPVRGLGRSLMADSFRLDSAEVQVIDGDVRVHGRLARPWWSAFSLDDPQR